MQAHWTRCKTIGCGSSATISTAVCRVSGELFAVKSTEISQSEPLQNEQRILSSLSCPHIVSYKGFDITREKNKVMYNIHLEYVPGGSLFDEIQRNKGELDEPKIAYYTRQILQGLQFVHSHGVVHCDIKSKNILVDEQVVKIADFGCAKRVEHAEDEAVQMGGTPMFMAPEVARGIEQRYPCDIWALGCTVVEMSTAARLPWQNVSDPASLLYKIAYSDELPAIPSCLSEHAKDFLGKCLKRNPEERWTAAQLLGHSFVVGINSTVKQVQDSQTLSPTSILDHQGFWSSVEESKSVKNSVPERAIQRIGLFSGEPRWANDESWITIRGNNEVEDNSVANDEDIMCCCSVSASTSHGNVEAKSFDLEFCDFPEFPRQQC